MDSASEAKKKEANRKLGFYRYEPIYIPAAGEQKYVRHIHKWGLEAWLELRTRL